MRRCFTAFFPLLASASALSASDPLQSALQNLAKLRAEGRLDPHTITLPPGTSFHPLALDATLVGNGLTIRARDPDGPPVILSAGTPVTDWKVQGGAWVAPVDLPEVLQVFINDAPRPRCRIPNDGYWRIEKSGPDRRTSFTWQENTIPPIIDLAHTELLFLHDWSITRVGVKSLDPATRTLTTTHPIGPPAPHYAIDNYEPQPRFALEGARDFLDAPGEWHFDRTTRLLTYRPRPGESPDTVSCLIPSHPFVLKLSGTPESPLANLRFEGLTFAHAHWQPPVRGYAAGQATSHDAPPGEERTFIDASVEANHCTDLTFENCTFRHSDGGGLWINQGCTGVAITRCKFQQLGGNGLMLGEPGNPTNLTHHVTVENCLIEEIGARYFGAVGLWIGIAADCTIRSNEIRNLPYTGLSLGWRWSPVDSACKGHLVEDNHIHHVLLTLSDGGGIYTLGRQPGTILRNNHIHDVRVNAGRAESNGIFMDEGTTDLLVEGNHIHDIARSPIRFHQAGRNTLRHNKLEPAEGVPPLRFNSTPEENITVE